MISMLNWDSSFFEIEKDGVTQRTSPLLQALTENVISLEVVEELGKAVTGSIQFQDDMNVVSSLIPMGSMLTIRWGYKRNDLSGRTAYYRSLNPDEIYSPALQQRTVRGRVTSPSGEGSQDGRQTYSCQFMSAYGMYAQNMRSFNTGTKGSVVREVLFGMGVNQMFVAFRRERERVTNDTAILQGNMTDFMFLNNYAREWRCIFRLGVTSGRNPRPVALFCDFENDSLIDLFNQTTTNCMGASAMFEYKKGMANCKNYTWNYGGGGHGDNVRIVMGANGQPQFFRYRAETQSVVVYRMQPQNIRRAMQAARASGGFRGEAEFMIEALKINTMDELVARQFFVPATETTAPQGVGLSMNLDTIGNPFCTAPTRAKFGDGFPSIFHHKSRLKFYMTRVSHTMSRQGYMNSVQVQDAFAISNGTMVS